MKGLRFNRQELDEQHRLYKARQDAMRAAALAETRLAIEKGVAKHEAACFEASKERYISMGDFKWVPGECFFNVTRLIDNDDIEKLNIQYVQVEPSDNSDDLRVEILPSRFE